MFLLVWREQRWASEKNKFSPLSFTFFCLSLLNEPETLFATNNIIMSLGTGFYIAAIYFFTYQVISSELYVSHVTANNNKFLHCIPKELWKMPINPFIQSKHDAIVVWGNLDHKKITNLHSIFIQVCRQKLNWEHYEWFNNKRQDNVHIINLHNLFPYFCQT